MDSPATAATRRLARARAALAEHELDGLLVNHLPNVRYLTGFTGSNGWLLLDPTAAVFMTDGRYEQQAEEELPEAGGFELVVARDGVMDDLIERANDRFKGFKVAFEARHLSYADGRWLQEHAGSVSWQASTDLLERLRAVKDDDELQAMKRAADIAVSALSQILALIEPGVREVDIAAELDFRMRRLGAAGPAFETIVASGERTALPHASASVRRVREGDLLLCDLGAIWRGYCSDLTRTFVIGDPRPRQAEVYEAVVTAQRAAFAALREGACGADVDRAARETFAAMDLDAQFAHSTGHGLGLEVHEGPRLHRQSEEELEAGMVVTVEPGLYFPGWGGVRIEDDSVVGSGEPRLLTDLARDELRTLPE